jgi:hypothetical protein
MRVTQHRTWHAASESGQQGHREGHDDIFGHVHPVLNDAASQTAWPQPLHEVRSSTCIAKWFDDAVP